MRVFRFLILVVLCVGCLEPYLPPEIEGEQAFLVVDGYIDRNGSAIVKLSRSIPLSSKIYSPPGENGAEVSIETSSGDTFNLLEEDSSIYTTSGLVLNADDEYILHIRTSDGHEYESDKVKMYATPPIDSAYFTISPTRREVEINVNANDPNPDATGFYLWDCIETYQYHAPHYSGYKIGLDGKIDEREEDEILYMCWLDVTKPSVMLNTRYLSENVISSQHVALIPKGSQKIQIRYSVLIKQRAISEAEYSFRTQLQNTTEQQGSLFSVIPGAVVSNIRSKTDPGRYVLGYFRAQEVKEKRLYVDFDELPEDFKILTPPPPDCAPRKTCSIPTPAAYFDCTPVEQLGYNTLITTADTNGAGVVTNYNYVLPACGDCRYFGGTTVPPSYWQGSPN